LKTEYDLRGQKHRGEEKRKEIFVTSHQKQIKINKDVSKKAADLARKGRVSIFLTTHAVVP
jgi:adenylate kinase